MTPYRRIELQAAKLDELQLLQRVDGSILIKANQRDRKTGASQPLVMKGISWVPPHLVLFEKAGIGVLLVLFS